MSFLQLLIDLLFELRQHLQKRFLDTISLPDLEGAGKRAGNPSSATALGRLSWLT